MLAGMREMKPAPLSEAEALRALYRGSIVKDEMFVAFLMTRPRKERELYERYGLSREEGDRIKVRVFNRPRLNFGKSVIEWGQRSPLWFLRLVRGLRPFRGILRNSLFSYHRQSWHFQRVYASFVDRLLTRDKWTDEEKTLLVLPLEIKGYREVRGEGEAEAIERLLRYLSGFPARKNEEVSAILR